MLKIRFKYSKQYIKQKVTKELKQLIMGKEAQRQIYVFIDLYILVLTILTEEKSLPGWFSVPDGIILKRKVVEIAIHIINDSIFIQELGLVRVA